MIELFTQKMLNMLTKVPQDHDFNELATLLGEKIRVSEITTIYAISVYVIK